MTAHRLRERGQMIPLVALMMVALFAMAALALDGGLAFSDRRADQNLADNAAMAGAQDLTASQSQAYTTAETYLQKGLSQSSPPTCAGAGGHVSCWYFKSGSSGAHLFDFDLYNPPQSKWNVPTSAGPSNMLEVDITHHNTGNFLAAARISSVLDIGAAAIAVAGKPRTVESHAVWSTETCNGKNGCGNTLVIDGTGAAEVDDGQNGTDCKATNQPDLFSDEKIHAPGQNLDINGGIHRVKADQDSSLLQYWNTGGPSSTTSDPDPAYLPPTQTAASYHTVDANTDNPAPTKNGTTLYMHPGHYTTDVTIGNSSTVTVFGTAYTNISTVQLNNGIYYFDSANLVIDTNSAGPSVVSQAAFGVSPPTAEADTTTDGVQLYFTGTKASEGYFWAKSGLVNLQGPSKTDSRLWSSSGWTNWVTIFVDSQDAADTGAVGNGFGWAGNKGAPLAIGTDAATPYPGAPGRYFHENGVVYLGYDSSKKAPAAFIAPSSHDSTQYAVDGQFVSPYVGINQGNLTGAVAGTNCASEVGPTGAARVVRFNSAFLPTEDFGVGSSLYQ